MQNIACVYDSARRHLEQPSDREYLKCSQPVDPTEYQNEWIGDVVSDHPIPSAVLHFRRA
jgi:hypothetical protein